jgi:hypothetical protein
MVKHTRSDATSWQVVELHIFSESQPNFNIKTTYCNIVGHIKFRRGQ